MTTAAQAIEAIRRALESGIEALQQEADEHRRYMAAYRPARQAELELEVADARAALGQCDALRDRMAELERANAWQPIATAPKDGTWIQLWRKPWESVGVAEPLIFGRWDAGQETFVWPDGVYEVFTEYGRECAEEDLESDNFHSKEFTHWKPLPTTPDAADRSAG